MNAIKADNYFGKGIYSTANARFQPRRMKSVLQKRIRQSRSRTKSVEALNITDHEKPLYNKDGDIVPPVPPKSPELIVRRRSLHSRSRSSNPVTRFFRKLFRLRRNLRKTRKLNYKYSKQQVSQKLSFDVPGYKDWSNTNFVSYDVNSTDLLKLHPKLKKSPLSSKKSLMSIKKDSVENIRLYGTELHRPDPLRLSWVSQTSNSMAKHRKPDRELPTAMRTQGSSFSEADKRRSNESEGLDILPHSKQNLIRIDSLKFSNRRAHEKELKHLSREVSVQRSATRSSRRSGRSAIDYDSIRDRQSAVLSREASKKSVRSDVFKNDETLDSAISFVDTWSRYLQQAIAVRVKLQQEIHQWEMQEERDWRNSFNSSARSDLTDDASTISIDSLSSFSSSSTFSSSKRPRRSEYDKLYFSSENKKQTRRPVSMAENSVKEFFSDDIRPESEFSFRNMFRSSTDPRMRFSVLLGDRNSLYSSGESDLESLQVEKETKLKRSGTVTGRSVSDVLTTRPRPLPDIPLSIPKKSSSITSFNDRFHTWEKTRSSSERVYRQLDRLQARSAEICDAIASSRPGSQTSSHSQRRHSFHPLPSIPVSSEARSRSNSSRHDLHLTVSGTENEDRFIPSALGFDHRSRNESVSSGSSHSSDLHRGGGIKRKRRSVAKHISVDSAWNSTDSASHSSAESSYSR